MTDLKSILTEALALPAGPAREAYLDEACRGDPALRAQVEALLGDHERLGTFLASARGAADHEVTITLEPGSSSVLREVAEALGGMPRMLLRDTDPVGAEAETVERATEDVPPPADRTGRYQLFGEIARGGMGAVLKARDPDLNRELAIKVLLESHRGNVDLVRRFIEEAQIGGQLQHPGIVPIYDVGSFADRRPFFAMKLVRGRTLTELLAEGARRRRGEEATVPVDSPPAGADDTDRLGSTAEAGDARPAPDREANSHDEAYRDLPRFLTIFEAVCQTMAYAHARGVIHRDLKPSNIMVGNFGEVQVMDWGLAKVLLRDGGAGPTVGERPQSAEGVVETARSGSDSHLSRAGSVMGTPAYMAPEQARGELDAIDQRADVFALGSILCEILTGKPAFTGPDRHEIVRLAASGDTTTALARLEQCRADADLVALARDCIATEPSARPRSAGAVAERVTSYLSGVQERLRTSERERAVAEARAVEERRRRKWQVGLAASLLALVATTAGGYSWLQLQRAVAARERADRLARAADAIDSAMVEAAQRRGEALAVADAESAPERWVEALAAARRADDLARQGDTDELRLARSAALLAEIRRAKLAADERTALLRADRALLSELETIRTSEAEHEDPERTDAEYAAAFRAAGVDLDAIGLEKAGSWLTSRTRPAELAAYLDDWADMRREAGNAEPTWRLLLQAAQVADPDPWRNALRARMGATDPGALDELRRLAEDRSGLEDQPPVSLVLLARQLKLVANERERAESVLNQAARRHPGDFWVHYELAHAYERNPRGGDTRVENIFPRPSSAVRHLSAALALRPGNAVVHRALAYALIAAGQAEEGEQEYREAIRLKPDYAEAYSTLGAALMDRGELIEAESNCREAVRLAPAQMFARSNLGSVLLAQQRFAEAEAEFRESIRLDPKHASPHFNLGIALRDQGRLAEAETANREAIRLAPNHVGARGNLGIILASQGKFAEAESVFREAVRLSPDSTQLHLYLAMALQEQGQFDQAAAEFREAGRLEPDNAKTHLELANLLYGLGKHADAAVEAAEVARLEPDNPEAHALLGFALDGSGQGGPGLQAWRRSVELNPNQPKLWYWIGRASARDGHPDEAIAAYQEAVRRGPADPESQGELAWLLAVPADCPRADAAVALEHARKAIAIQPGNLRWHTALALAELRSGDWDPAITAGERSLKLGAGADAIAGFILALARAGKGQPEEARAWFDKAVSWVPKDAPPAADLRTLWAEAAERLGLPRPE